MKKVIWSALAFVVAMTFIACSDYSPEGEPSFLVMGQIYDKHFSSG